MSVAPLFPEQPKCCTSYRGNRARAFNIPYSEQYLSGYGKVRVREGEGEPFVPATLHVELATGISSIDPIDILVVILEGLECSSICNCERFIVCD